MVATQHGLVDTARSAVDRAKGKSPRRHTTWAHSLSAPVSRFHHRNEALEQGAGLGVLALVAQDYGLIKEGLWAVRGMAFGVGGRAHVQWSLPPCENCLKETSQLHTVNKGDNASAIC